MNKRIKIGLLVMGALALIGFLVSRTEGAPYDEHRVMDVVVDGNSTATLDRIQKAFNAKDYTTANVHLSRFAEYYKNNAELQLYYGITLMETGQYDMARMTFKKIAGGDSLYHNEAQWYLALNAFNQHDYEACKLFISEIPQEANEYSKAQTLLGKL